MNQREEGIGDGGREEREKEGGRE
jgi:hypothetical protein